jgi:phosphoglycerol transferase MdoB-like AlkP superfamily enzyme
MAEVNAADRPFGLRVIDFVRKKVSVLLLALVLLLLVPYLLKYLSSQKPALVMPASRQTLSINELLTDLKTELGQRETEREEKNEAAVFDILSFDLEISFMVRANSAQRSGVEYQVVTADSQIQQGMEKIQKLTLHMKPSGKQQEPTKAIAYPDSKAKKQ